MLVDVSGLPSKKKISDKLLSLISFKM